MCMHTGEYGDGSHESVFVNAGMNKRISDIKRSEERNDHDDKGRYRFRIPGSRKNNTD